MPNEYEDLDDFDDDWDDDLDDDDYCWECSGYGDDYYTDENGELVCACSTCWRRYSDDDWDD